MGWTGRDLTSRDCPSDGKRVTAWPFTCHLLDRNRAGCRATRQVAAIFAAICAVNPCSLPADITYQLFYQTICPGCHSSFQTLFHQKWIETYFRVPCLWASLIVDRDCYSARASSYCQTYAPGSAGPPQTSPTAQATATARTQTKWKLSPWHSRDMCHFFSWSQTQSYFFRHCPRHHNKCNYY